MRIPRWSVVAMALAAAPVVAVASRAQGPSDTALVRGRDDTEAQKLFALLMSPFCPGLTLAQCPSPGADSLRRDIRSRLEIGQTPRAITAAYASEWGEQMLGTPPVRDWGVLLWTLPGALLLAGGAALTVWLARLRRLSAAGEAARAGTVAALEPLEPALRQRLDAELEAFEKNA